MYEIPVAVKDTLKGGRHKKNYVIEVLNDDGTTDFTIDNDNIVQESVSIDERMDSGDDIKFGLCEGSSIQFQYFGFSNISGRRVKIGIEVDYVDADDTIQQYTIPMGYFDIEKCARQASTGIMEATGYNKLQSKYLDQKANQILDDTFTHDDILTVFDIKYTLLRDYQIMPDFEQVSPTPPQHGDITKLMWDIIVNKPIYFQSDIGVNSPMSFWEYEHNTEYHIPGWHGHVMYPYFRAHRYEFGLSEAYPYKLFEYLEGDYETFERSVYQRVIDEYDRALFKNSNNVAVSGQDVVNKMLQDNQWCYLCGIVVDSWGASYYEYYSTIQYEYNLAHNLSVAHVYPAREFFTKLIKNVPAIPPAISATDVTVCFPSTFGLSTTLDFEQDFDLLYWFFDGNVHDLKGNHYTYYTSATETANGYIYKLYYSNGKQYDDEHERGGQDAVLGYQISTSDLTPADLLTFQISKMPEFTLRDIASAVYETECMYGHLDRVTDLFHGVELNRSRLYPAEDLYPDNQLYPGGSAMSASKMMYFQLWADDGNVRKWRYLIITYKTLNGNNEEVEATLQRTIDEHGTDNYNMSDNWIFKNMVWTAADVGAYADAMVAKMTGITWFPFEMWLPGLPYIETGDEIEVTVNGNTYPTYVLQRQLQGVQNLQDTYINGTLDIF